jgi:uncharacterized membrane protein YkvA (DUF1232 family)
MIDVLKRGLDAEITASGLGEALRQHATHLPADDVEQLASVLEQFLRAIPDALAFALALSKDPRCGRSVAFATGPILNYLFDDEDLLPESSFGALGLLDDAYLVHVFVAMLQQMYPFATPAPAYSAPDRRAFEVVASFLPEGVAHSLRRTCESTIMVAQALVPIQTNGTAASLTPPEIRVSEAARTASEGSRAG